MIQINVHNLSTVLPDEKLLPILAACQTQVARDVIPIWGYDQINFTIVQDKNSFAAGAWRFVAADTSDEANAAGYHEDQSDVPIGYAFVKSTMDAGMMPSVTISHEILEMLGDPFINSAEQWADFPNPVWLSLELCDPVEDDALGYQVGGIQMSNFVTPDYFIPGSEGPWDFQKHLSAANTLTDGGYQLEWTLKGWNQRTSFRALGGETRFVPARRAAPDYASIFSRRTRRLVAAKRRAERFVA